jgi:hypothetical protein
LEYLSELLEYISTSPNLQSLHLWEEDESLEMGAVILDRIKDCTNIVDLTLEEVTVPCTAFSTYLRSTPSLCTLCFKTSTCDFDNIELAASAIHANRTLQTVKVDATKEAPVDVTISILQALDSHPTLLELEFSTDHRDGMEYTDVLTNVMRSTLVLQKLSLTGFHFTVEATEMFVDALNQNQSITKLALLDSAFEADQAAEQFGQWLQSERATTGLSELHLSGGSPLFTEDGVYTGAAIIVNQHFVDIETMTVRSI